MIGSILTIPPDVKDIPDAEQFARRSANHKLLTAAFIIFHDPLMFGPLRANKNIINPLVEYRVKHVHASVVDHLQCSTDYEYCAIWSGL